MLFAMQNVTKKRSSERLLVSVISLLLFGLIAGCGVSKSDLVGNYERDYKGVSETVKIRPGGTFTQTVYFKDGRTWEVTDKWVQLPKGLTFESWYETFDPLTGSSKIPPQKGAMRNCAWIEGYLVLNDVGSYVLKKVD